MADTTNSSKPSVFTSVKNTVKNPTFIKGSATGAGIVAIAWAAKEIITACSKKGKKESK